MPLIKTPTLCYTSRQWDQILGLRGSTICTDSFHLESYMYWCSCASHIFGKEDSHHQYKRRTSRDPNTFGFFFFFSSVQLLSRVRLFATPWIAAHQASLSITDSWSLPKLMSIESVMPSSHLTLCCPLLLLPPIPPSITVFSSESTLHMRWPEYWSFSFSISPSINTQDWSPLGWTGWISLQSKGLSRAFSNTTVQKHQFFGTQLSSESNSHIHTWPLEKP